MHDLASDWETVHAPGRDAVTVINKRAAARRIAAFSAQLPRIVPRLVDDVREIEPARPRRRR